MSERKRGFAYSSDWLSHAVKCLVESKVRYRSNVRAIDLTLLVIACVFMINIASWFILLENLAATLYKFFRRHIRGKYSKFVLIITIQEIESSR